MPHPRARQPPRRDPPVPAGKAMESKENRRESSKLAVGGVGIGTNSPQTQLDVTRNVSGTASPGNHVAYFHNTADSNGDVLMLQSDRYDPVGVGVNFITFRNVDSNIGAIEGEGIHKVTAAVGLGSEKGVFVRRLARQAETIESLRERVTRLEAALARVLDSDGSEASTC